MINKDALNAVKNKEILNATEAARILNYPVQGMMTWIKSGSCPFGSYVNNNVKGQYFITKHQMLKHFGIKE